MKLVDVGDKHPSNKPPYYLTVYEPYFAPLAGEPVRLLELGVNRGGSLEIWAEYFARGTIVGIDIKDIVEIDAARKPVVIDGRVVLKHFASERIFSRMGSQDDAAFLAALSAELAPGGWDIIIDDCSHVGELSQKSFLALFPKLKIGGLYIVEDWGVGYAPDFAEGRRFDETRHFTNDAGEFPVHTAGLAGFVKQFVDEVGMDDINGLSGVGRGSAFDWVHCYKGAVLVKKRRDVARLRFGT